MLFDRSFTIEPDNVPDTPQEICFAVAKYCGENNLDYEFETREYPVIARIGHRRYKITKEFTKRFRINLWVLRCKEIQ